MHAPEALEILENPTQKEIEILSAFKYKENSAVLHSDNNILYSDKNVCNGTIQVQINKIKL